MAQTAPRANRQIVFKHDGGSDADTVYGFYVTKKVREKEVLVYAERFAVPKRMEKLGDEIRITFPEVNIHRPLHLALGLKEVPIVDEVGLSLGGGSACFAIRDEFPIGLRDLFQDLNELKARAHTERTRTRKGKSENPERDRFFLKLVAEGKSVYAAVNNVNAENSKNKHGWKRLTQETGRRMAAKYKNSLRAR